MEMLYKYYSNESKYAFDNIEKEIINFTPIESLNDPFEGIGAYVYPITTEEKDYWDLVSPDTPKILSESTIKLIYNIANFRFRIFSSSNDYDNPLLWAHYANSHKGFCVGYNKSDIKGLQCTLQDINYESELYSINDTSLEEIKKLLYVKSDKWRYENECRAVYELHGEDVEYFPPQMYYDIDIKKRHTEHLNNYIFDMIGTVQTPLHATLCSPKRICQKCKPVEIYLGLKIGTEDRKRLISIAKKLQIKIYQMKRSQHSFDFIREEIDPSLIELILQIHPT